MEKGKELFRGPKTPDRGYTAAAFELLDDTSNALIEVYKEGIVGRSFLFPAYKIWNIPAHFSDIVDSEIAKDQDGYAMAAFTGFGFVPMKEINSQRQA